MALICDTGPLFAAMDQADRDHDRCAGLLETIEEEVLVPSPVIVELDWLAGERLDPKAFSTFIDDIQSARIKVVDLLQEDYSRIRQVLDRYQGLKVGFVDAAVLAVVERLKEPKLATLDQRHFTVLRPQHVPALRLLP